MHTVFHLKKLEDNMKDLVADCTIMVFCFLLSMNHYSSVESYDDLKELSSSFFSEETAPVSLSIRTNGVRIISCQNIKQKHRYMYTQTA